MSASLFLVFSDDAGEGLQRRGASTGYSAAKGRVDVLALARALSTSPLWREMPGAVLVARTSPRPALGVLGRFDAAAQRLLAELPHHLNDALSCGRYVSYAQAEEDCELLAARLIERFGRDGLRRFHFTAIPRGGFIVLGMLSYVLDLGQEQLEPPRSPETPLVVVDDCAISGSRFGRFIERCGSREIVFAHLYSHPDLRASIEMREPAVTVCVGARDLNDHAPERFGEGYDEWRQRWLDRGEGHQYWIGRPDHLAFAWNEPDVAIWNATANRAERAWRIVPPELCLKNRAASGAEEIPVQVQPEGVRSLRPAPNVLFGELEGRVLICNTETGENFGVSGVAADLWKAIVECGDEEDAVADLSGEYEVDEDILRADLREFVGDLLSQGLMERSHAAVVVD